MNISQDKHKMFKATPFSWIIEVRGSSKMGEEESGKLFKFYKRFMLILSRPLVIIKCSRGIFLPPNYKMTVTYNSYQNYMKLIWLKIVH